MSPDGTRGTKVVKTCKVCHQTDVPFFDGSDWCVACVAGELELQRSADNDRVDPEVFDFTPAPELVAVPDGE